MRFFDKTEVYKTQVEPLLDKVREICKEHNIPFVSFAAYFLKDDGEGGGEQCIGRTINVPIEYVEGTYLKLIAAIADLGLFDRQNLH